MLQLVEALRLLHDAPRLDDERPLHAAGDGVLDGLGEVLDVPEPAGRDEVVARVGPLQELRLAELLRPVFVLSQST